MLSFCLLICTCAYGCAVNINPRLLRPPDDLGLIFIVPPIHQHLLDICTYASTCLVYICGKSVPQIVWKRMSDLVLNLQWMLEDGLSFVEILCYLAAHQETDRQHTYIHTYNRPQGSKVSLQQQAHPSNVHIRLRCVCMYSFGVISLNMYRE